MSYSIDDLYAVESEFEITNMFDRSTKWRGEGITEVLVVIVVVNFVLVVVAPVVVVMLVIATGQSVFRTFTSAYLAVIFTSAGLAASLAAFVARRARWRWGGIVARAGACGACGVTFGLVYLALLREMFGT